LSIYGTFGRFAQGMGCTVPGGESYRSVFERFARVLSRAREDHDTLMVTHGGVIRAIVPFVCVNAAALQGVRIPENTGLVVLEPYDTGRYICESWNLVDHLSGGN
jgi:broad specificity phosphatase PhoE